MKAIVAHADRLEPEILVAEFRLEPESVDVTLRHDRRRLASLGFAVCDVVGPPLAQHRHPLGLRDTALLLAIGSTFSSTRRPPLGHNGLGLIPAPALGPGPARDVGRARKSESVHDFLAQRDDAPAMNWGRCRR